MGGRVRTASSDRAIGEAALRAVALEELLAAPLVELARRDAAAAEPTALALLARSDTPAWAATAAVEALGFATSEAGLAALFDALDRDDLRITASRTLAGAAHPRTGDEALARLTPELLRFDRVVGTGTVHPDDAARAGIVRALLQALAHHRHPEAARVLAGCTTHRLEDLRYHAAKLRCWLADDATLRAAGVMDPDRLRARLGGVVPWTELRPVLAHLGITV